MSHKDFFVWLSGFLSAVEPNKQFEVIKQQMSKVEANLLIVDQVQDIVTASTTEQEVVVEEQEKVVEEHIDTTKEQVEVVEESLPKSPFYKSSKTSQFIKKKEQSDVTPEPDPVPKNRTIFRI